MYGASNGLRPDFCALSAFIYYIIYASSVRLLGNRLLIKHKLSC